MHAHRLSQEFAQREQRNTRYRGYDIKMVRRDLCWMVTMKPSGTELPTFPRCSFHTATQSEREALKQARRRIDTVWQAAEEHAWNTHV
jgi:hypothetical protein